jgi:hypothetical protein
VVASYTFVFEISLFSFGFSGAQDVAEKNSTTLSLGSEQLSSLPRQCKDHMVCNNCLLVRWVIQQFFVSKQIIELQCDFD